MNLFVLIPCIILGIIAVIYLFKRITLIFIINKLQTFPSLSYFLKSHRNLSESEIKNALSKALGMDLDFKIPTPNKDFEFWAPLSSTGWRFKNKIKDLVLYNKNLKWIFQIQIHTDALRISIPEAITIFALEDKCFCVRKESQNEAYRMLGKIMSVLGSEDCIKIYSPAIKKSVNYDKSIAERMANEDPIKVLKEKENEEIKIAKNRANKESNELISLVYLIKTPRKMMSEMDVRTAVSNALGIVFDTNTPHPEEFVGLINTVKWGKGKIQTFGIKIKQGGFTLNLCSAPYHKDHKGQEKAADMFVDTRLKRITLEHTAWLSIDLMKNSSNLSKLEIYQTIAKIMSVLGADDCIGIYSPELEILLEYENCIKDALAACDDPLNIFREPPYFDPIIDIRNDDPRMIVAVNEAKTHWSDFVAAFAQKTEKDTNFVIKSGFKDKDVQEFMWVNVSKIAGDKIYGTLCNKPDNLTNLKEGQEVAVNLSDLSDWMYEKNSETFGYFSKKVLDEAIQQQRTKLAGRQ